MMRGADITHMGHHTNRLIRDGPEQKGWEPHKADRVVGTEYDTVSHITEGSTARVPANMSINATNVMDYIKQLTAKTGHQHTEEQGGLLNRPPAHRGATNCHQHTEEQGGLLKQATSTQRSREAFSKSSLHLSTLLISNNSSKVTTEIILNFF